MGHAHLQEYHIRVKESEIVAWIGEFGDEGSREAGPLTQSYVLIQAEEGRAVEIANTISGIPGVVQAEEVAGPYDIVVRAEARSADELSRLVEEQIRPVEGVVRIVNAPTATVPGFNWT
jgi:DNA-binding Lrp family transcriptional regulator